MAYSARIMCKFLGDEVRDLRGRSLGRILGLVVDYRDVVIGLKVGLADGSFITVDHSQIRVEGEGVSIVPPWKLEAELVCEEHESLARRLKAAAKLLEDGDINEEAYRDLKHKCTEVLNELKARGQSLREKMQTLLQRIDEQIKEHQEVLVNNKMLYLSGNLDEQTYKNVTMAIRQSLEKKIADKVEVQELLSKLSALETPTFVPDEKLTEEGRLEGDKVIVVKLAEEV